LQIYGKIDENCHLVHKKALLRTMEVFYRSQGKDPFAYMPQSYIIEEGEDLP